MNRWVREITRDGKNYFPCPYSIKTGKSCHESLEFIKSKDKFYFQYKNCHIFIFFLLRNSQWESVNIRYTHKIFKFENQIKFFCNLKK